MLTFAIAFALGVAVRHYWHVFVAVYEDYKEDRK